MITRVTPADYNGITKTFTDEEIKEKYGKLIVMSKEEYREYLKKIKKKLG